jgi:radical SAM superfamily enzyme YgiQ (UPF0313 family)
MNTTESYDIILLQLPYNFVTPVPGIASLKSNIEKHNFKCKIIDLNYKTIQLFKHKYDLKNILTYKWLDVVSTKITDGDKINEEDKKIFQDIFPIWLDEINQYKPKFIGLSVLNVMNLIPFFDIFKDFLIKKCPDSKFVIGGSGLFLNGTADKYLKEQNFIDYFIYGDGEDAIIKLLNDDYESINEYQKITNLDDYPFPDYTDYPKETLENLEWLSVISSRGCVRSCNFCWRKYKGFNIKNPDLVIQEMIEIHEKYKPTKIIFDDSLINADRLKLNCLLDNIINYNKTIDNPILWNGNFACLPVKDSDVVLYKKIKESNNEMLFIGIESGSEKVRRDMHKPLKDYDKYFMLSNLNKNKINVVMGIIIGYYSETEEDFQETLNFFKWCKNNLDTQHLTITFSIFSITENSLLWKTAGINYDKNNQWEYKNINNFPIRYKRLKETIELSNSLGINILTPHKDYFSKVNKQYQKKLNE